MTPSRVPIGVVVLLLAALPALAADNFFGINGVGYMHYRDQGDAAVTAHDRLAWMREAGASSDRFDFWWGVMEPEQGRFDWSRGDRLMGLYEGQDVALLPILCYASAWSGNMPPADEQEQELFARWVGAVVRRYGDRVRTWEIWNEPNIRPFWVPRPNPDLYTPLLKKAYAAAKEADPDCVVVGGVTSLTDLPFLDRIGELGGFEAMDAVSIHPYSLADSPVEAGFTRQIALLRRLLARHGAGEMPIWVTEVGWQADPADPEAVARQSAYLAQTLALFRGAGVQRVFWFNLVDWSETWGIVSQQGDPKPSLRAYRQSVNALSDTTFRGYADLPGLHALVFAGEDHDVAVLWARRGSIVHWRACDAPVERVAVPAVSGVFDLYGDRLAPERGRDIRTAVYRIGPEPVYVVMAARASWPVHASPIRDPNLLVNGGFEHTVNGDPYGWQRGSFLGGVDDGVFRPGQRSWEGHGAVGLAASKNAAWESFHVPVMPGSRVQLEAMVRCEGCDGASRIELLMLGGSGWPFRGLIASEPVAGTRAWAPLRLEAEVPVDASHLRVRLASRDNPGLVVFDRVTLTASE